SAAGSEQVLEASAEAASEKISEVRHIVGSAGEAASAAACGSRGFCLFGKSPVVTVLVILRALLLVGEHLVRGGDLLEALLGLLVVRIQVWVKLTSEPPVCLANLFVRGAALDAQNLVKI